MGLDMYLFRLTRLNLKEREMLEGKDAETIRGLGYSVFLEIKNKKYKYAKDFLSPIASSVRMIDFKKIKADFEIPDDANRQFASYGSAETTFEYGNESGFEKTVKIPNSEMESKYTYAEPMTVYVWKEEEVAYWRKNWDLREKLTRVTKKNIKNMGYYPLTDRQVSVIERISGKKIPRARDEGETVAYFEWY